MGLRTQIRGRLLIFASQPNSSTSTSLCWGSLMYGLEMTVMPTLSSNTVVERTESVICKPGLEQYMAHDKHQINSH